MDTLITIGYVFAIAVVLYLAGLMSVRVYSIKKKALYQKMLEQLVKLENFQMTTAVAHAKTYKILADYHRSAKGLERVQQLILKIMLLKNRKIQ